MQRLITFGCSFTYGSGLPDCCGENGSGPDPNITPASKMGWPAVLAKDLDLELINCSKPGASNLEILYHILNFKFNESDTVVVMWTIHNRDIFFKKSIFSKHNFRQLGVWMSDKIAMNWMKNLDEHDMGTKTWIYMHHADLVLKQNRVNYIHYPAFYHEFEKYKPNFINIDNLHKNSITLVDQVPDKHPGLKSNLLTAKSIRDILKCKLI